MRKGVILEINDLYLTLLTPEGEFLRTRKLQQDYQVGEEIHFFPEMSADKRKKFNLSFLNSFKVRTISLAATFMLVMTAFIPVYQGGQVYAYMSIDVNPSVELAVNDELKVLRLTGYNREGDEIIDEITGWKKKDAAEVAEMILDKIEEKGFFEENKDVVISTVHNGKVKEAADRKLNKKISEIKKATQEEKLELKVMQATSDDREKAKKQGLTTGIYKEKQKTKPVSKPVNEKEKARPQAIQKKPAAPLKAQPQPTRQEAPHQINKHQPQAPKAKKVNPSSSAPDKNKGQSNEKAKSKKESKKNGKGKYDNDNNGKKIASSRKANVKKSKNNSNKQQFHKKENRGHSDKNNARIDKK